MESYNARRIFTLNKVIKHGTKEITREGFEYELTVNFEIINDKHLVRASKDRTGLFMDKPEFVINSATGKKLMEWCNQGISIDKISTEIESCHTEDELKKLYEKYPSFKNQTYPLILNRKSQLENSKQQLISEDQIVEPKTVVENGSSS